MPRLATFLPLALALGVAAASAAAAPVSAAARIDELLRDPTAAEWRSLARFDGTLTEAEFAQRLEGVFDPGGGLRPYLELRRDSAEVFANAARRGPPLAVVRLAPAASLRRPRPVGFRTPAQFRAAGGRIPGRPLAGLRVAIEPADIGGRWARIEDRSVYFRGYGRINEGDLNLVVGRLLDQELTRLGASVFLVRDRTEPVVALRVDDVLASAAEVMRDRPWLLPEAYWLRPASGGPSDPARLRLAAGLLLTKTLETRARAELVRRFFAPDLVIVLQHDASPDSGAGRLTSVNRNIFFVEGDYSPAELRETEQRYRLLLKLLADVTPVETEAAANIAERFRERTGFPPVLYGDSANTRLVVPGDPYVVARNLAFNREHDGPVVVTEPYFMNQPDTLARLLAGDYAGERLVAGRRRTSIFREYADCVAEGILRTYGPAR